MTPVLLITRPQPAAARFANAVQDALGEPVDVVVSPAFEIVPLDPGPIATPDYLIFTSANGVAQALRLGLPKVPAWCVGDKTAQCAQNSGFDAVSAGGAAADLIALIRTNDPQGRILHVAGQHTRGEIAPKLRAAGYDADKITTYAQSLLPPNKAMKTLARGTKPVVTPIFSPRSAHILVGLDWQGPIHAVALSDVVGEELVHIGCDTVAIAKRPTEAAMIDATCATLRALLDR